MVQSFPNYTSENFDRILNRQNDGTFSGKLNNEIAVFLKRKSRMVVFAVGTFLVSSFSLYWFVLEPIGFGSRRLDLHSPVYFFVAVWIIAAVSALIAAISSAVHAVREYKKATYYYILQRQSAEDAGVGIPFDGEDDYAPAK